jgi:chromosome segregation ATPase
MKKDLNFKQRQLNDAESTAAQLQVEVESRTQDLEKIKNLEGRMDKEMELYADNVAKMEDEMANKFTKTDELRAKHEHEKRTLSQIKRLVGLYRAALTKQSTYHAMSHDTKRNMIL